MGQTQYAFQSSRSGHELCIEDGQGNTRSGYSLFKEPDETVGWRLSIIQ